MATVLPIGESKFEHFIPLRTTVEKRRNDDIKKRVATNPHPTKLEYFIGAFIEMYEPQLQPIIRELFDKGYVIDVSSGFCGVEYECQAMIGSFAINDTLQNKLQKIGAKVHTANGFKSLKFWPTSPDFKQITRQWKQIVALLPNNGQPSKPWLSIESIRFRASYIPNDPKLKKHRLFTHLMFTILDKITIDIKKHLAMQTLPTDLELKLGVFVMMLEPQVRDAVLEFNRKGYSTDTSGFMDYAESQSIDGDFTLDRASKKKLEELGVVVETNPSGYTRLQFWPVEADFDKIKAMWDTIAGLLPDKHTTTSPSMTKRSRSFREKYVAARK